MIHKWLEIAISTTNFFSLWFIKVGISSYIIDFLKAICTQNTKIWKVSMLNLISTLLTIHATVPQRRNIHGPVNFTAFFYDEHRQLSLGSSQKVGTEHTSQLLA